ADRSGRELIDTGLAPRTPLGRVERPGMFDAAFDGGTAITDIYIDDTSHERVVAVAVPVRHGDGTIDKVLSTELSSENFAGVIMKPGVPIDWVVSIVDGNGVRLTRTQGGEQYAGQQLAPELMHLLKSKSGGAVSIVSLEGMRTLSTVSRGHNGFAAAVGMPE